MAFAKGGLDMPETDRSSTQKMHETSKQNDRRSGRKVILPKPTQDQSEYLQKIKDSAKDYDPAVVVGGPRRARS
jgi:hypothetical protein